MRREIYRGRIVDLRLERVTLPNGAVADLELMHHPGAACVAAVDENRRVMLIRQYRHAAGEYLWELPAGILAPNEEPQACARRELTEETGLQASTVEPLGAILPTPGYSDERIHMFLATDLQAGDTAHEADEVITEMRWVELGEALDMIARGEVIDAKSVAGLHLTAARLGVLR